MRREQLRLLTCDSMINCVTIPEFTKEQIADCHKCKHASKKKEFCSNPNVGVYIGEKSKIEYPSKIQMAKNFGKAAGKHIKSGLKKRSDVEQKRVMDICLKCEWYEPTSKLGVRCKKCGCCMDIKKRWATAHCPLKKW